jgi:hypothetical protein
MSFAMRDENIKEARESQGRGFPLLAQGPSVRALNQGIAVGEGQAVNSKEGENSCRFFRREGRDGDGRSSWRASSCSRLAVPQWIRSPGEVRDRVISLAPVGNRIRARRSAPTQRPLSPVGRSSPPPWASTSQALHQPGNLLTGSRHSRLDENLRRLSKQAFPSTWHQDLSHRKTP